MSSTIANKAVIALFTSGAWRVNRTHKDETAAVNAKHNTDKATVKVAVCDHPLLKQIGLVVSRARLDHYKITIPAADDGMRLLPNAQQLRHSELMQIAAQSPQGSVLADLPNLLANPDATDQLAELLMA